MENIHGVDISWMRSSNHSHKGSNQSTQNVSDIPQPPDGSLKLDQNGSGHYQKEHTFTPPPKILNHRTSFTRSNSNEKTANTNGSAQKMSPQSPARRNSWLSSISSKFSSSQGPHSATTPPGTPPASTTPTTQDPPANRFPGPGASKNHILQAGVKGDGDAPYTPAPPKSTQPNFLQSALRRLSSSGGQLSTGCKSGQYGLCERRVLNVDRHRERCCISELDQSRLRRVAFCVDVEIASGPQYTDDIGDDKKQDKSDKKRLVENGEGEALKHPEEVKNEEIHDGIVNLTSEECPQKPEDGATEVPVEAKDTEDQPLGEKDITKKKEKKKRSEEERKARKERKRKLAEENGIVPVELVRHTSDSSLGSIPSGSMKTQVSPTTDPLRIYRRCCQLRETPILKRITEQLVNFSTGMSQPGVVSILDLSGFWLQLPDLVTLGDYLAVVPVKELVMENCGLTDEGVRLILAGLLATKCPEYSRRKPASWRDGEVPQGGFIERLVLKDNVKIGRDGWRYICLFINMCRSIKSLDLSKVPFPKAPPPTPSSGGHSNRNTSIETNEISCLLAKAIGERLGGAEFELLNMAECGITTSQLGGLIDGVNKSGLRRLGIAGNSITAEGMEHIVRYLRGGKCEGLDLGGNNLKDLLGMIAGALDEDNSLYALSLADCNLNPESLWTLFPALAKLKNFRFIDLSQNHNLFDTKPSALSLLRRYLPRLPMLKRIHLTNVSMTPDQAIALAEILPESPNLAHVNIMENTLLAALANAKDEANQEEACAVYASLMAAVRVSQTIICIDIEVPSPQSSEIVKALAKQVVAYCLWNMERGPVAEISEAAQAISEPHAGEKDVAVPDVLLHLVGHFEGSHENHDDDEPAPDEDYVIGGTGVVKALGICLKNKGNDSRRPSADRAFSEMSGSGSATPVSPVKGASGKAKDMSKNLLGSARKIRARLQPALVKESRTGDRNNYHRLLFLDQTLEGMIKRFEDEYPETRLSATITTPPLTSPVETSPRESTDLSMGADTHVLDTETALVEAHLSEDEDLLHPKLSRHNSDVSIASRALSQEEGRMHRFGQKFRREIMKPETEDHEHGTTGREIQPEHIQYLRAMMEQMKGDEIKKNIESRGQDAVLEELGNGASMLRQIQAEDPESWQKFVESQQAAEKNQTISPTTADMNQIE